ncbi:OJ1005_B10.29 [Oryza sativa Japonica Group]|uniref:OJ1005_B10.29 protein n=1 Tax=Oryza sativa subsp. japonica TaxID=39947 RepID=Q8LH61_ORYSJ|nr:OJ1005_B10.29 [Oryza sativa Japonica Group]
MGCGVAVDRWTMVDGWMVGAADPPSHSHMPASECYRPKRESQWSQSTAAPADCVPPGNEKWRIAHVCLLLKAIQQCGRSLSGLTIATLKSQSMAASPSPPMLAAFIVQESNKSIASSRICSPKLHSRNHQENNLQTNPNRTQELPVNSGQSLVDELENQGENKKQEPQKPKNTPSEKFAPPCGFKNQEPQKVAPGDGAAASSLSPREEPPPPGTHPTAVPATAAWDASGCRASRRREGLERAKRSRARHPPARWVGEKGSVSIQLSHTYIGACTVGVFDSYSVMNNWHMRLLVLIFGDYWRVVLEMIGFSGDIQVLLFCLVQSDRSGVAGQTDAMRAREVIKLSSTSRVLRFVFARVQRSNWRDIGGQTGGTAAVRSAGQRWSDRRVSGGQTGDSDRRQRRFQGSQTGLPTAQARSDRRINLSQTDLHRFEDNF